MYRIMERNKSVARRLGYDIENNDTSSIKKRSKSRASPSKQGTFKVNEDLIVNLTRVFDVAILSLEYR